MVRVHVLGQTLAVGIAAGLIALSLAMPVQAQNATETTMTDLGGLHSQPDLEVTSATHHARPANTPAARNLRPREISTSHQNSPSASVAAAAQPEELFPGDLTFNGGKIVRFAESHPIFEFSKSAGCTSRSCWGFPDIFLTNLGNSEFIHIVDQYTGSTAGSRYTVGTTFSGQLGKPSPTKPLLDADMVQIAAKAAAKLGQAGYDHVFHIFLPPGQDICFTATDGVCYSPDVPATFFFCGYHGSADVTGVGHVLYSVEPFQNVPGCHLQSGTPNGEVIDSTANTLSHEMFETITDPDGTAWWNSTDNGLFGEEIGDECSFVNTTSFNAPAFRIGAKTYAVQREYDNHRHACTENP